MKINDIEKLVSDIDGDIFFNYDLKKLNWFNIGGKAEIFFKPNTLKSLVEFLNIYLIFPLFHIVTYQILYKFDNKFHILLKIVIYSLLNHHILSFH